MTSPVSMPAGHAIVATDLDAYENLTGVWTSYTPTWSSFGTLPVLNNGTLTGKYIRSGNFVTFEIELIIGSGTTFGTSTYTFTTPTAVATGSCCAAFLEDNSTGFRYAGSSTTDAGSGLVGRTVFTNGTVGFSATSPVTLATSDVVRIAGTYEAT